MKTRVKAGVAMPGTTSSALAISTSGRARPEGSRRDNSAAPTLVRVPPRTKSGPGSKDRTTPVKPESNSSQPISRGPPAGSLTATTVLPYWVRTPSTTRKCWKAQKMMTGRSRSFRFSASVW